MSRQITIKTEMTNEQILTSALKDLKVAYSVNGTSYHFTSAEGFKIEGYGTCGINVEDGKVFYDSDYREQKTFVQNVLLQMYNKHLVLDTMALEGHRVDEVYTATDSYITGLEDVVEAGDILIYGAANTF